MSQGSLLVTGASGFVGRHCLPVLVERGWEVHAVGREPDRAPSRNLTWHECDLLDPESSRLLLDKIRPTQVLHLAWFAKHGAFWMDPANLDWVAASLNLLRNAASVGARRIVGVGTCAEYGITRPICDEAAGDFSPAGTYAECKHAAHLCFQAARESLGISTAWALLFFPYGPHDDPNRLIPYTIRSLLDGKKAEFSSGTQMRDPLFVEDVASALIALLESDVEGPVNIAAGVPVSVREIVTKLGDIMGKTSLLSFGRRDLHVSEASRWVASVDRLTNELGWKPKYSLEVGLRDTVARMVEFSAFRNQE